MNLRKGREGEQDDASEEDQQLESEFESRNPSWRSRLAIWFRIEPRSESTRRTSRTASRNIVTSSAFTNSSWQGFCIHPNDWRYLVWKQFILIWAVYSSFFTPLEFGFFRGLPEDLFLLDIAGQIAFLVDIVVHFFVAYRDSHSYRMVQSRNLIAIRYLKSRFLVDLMGCLPWDAIYKACGRKEPVRYLLWIRLSRALRVTEFFEKMEKDIRINYLFTRIVKLLVVELYCTHTAACLFYYLATTLPPSQEGYTWIGSLKMGDFTYSHFRDIDLWKRYVTSLYFAVVTMATVGYGEIHAVNIREMIFVMVYVSFDMILGAYLLGNMTALIVKGSRTEKFRDKMADITKYMNRNNLGKQISREIKGHVRLQYDSRYSDAAFLHDIPTSIRAKISEKLYEPIVREVPLFKGCSMGFIKQIATKAHEELLLPGEVIVEQGHTMDQLYIVCYGELEEVGRNEDTEGEEHLHTNYSFGEISLLCNTPAPYTVRVRELSRLLRLDKQSFIDTLDFQFSDGRIIINNLLEGKESSLRTKLLESDIILHIGKYESELAMRLNCAAYDGDLYRLKRLIEAGADPNRTDYDGRSPLVSKADPLLCLMIPLCGGILLPIAKHLAASKGFEEITEFLIQKGVQIDRTDKFGNTPLLEAITNGHDHVVSLLVKAGSSLTIDDAGNCLCTNVARRNVGFIRRVLDNGINPNSKNYDLRTPLHVAASEGSYTVACLLLEAGASVFSKDRWGNTPIDEARLGGDKNLIRLLNDAKCTQLTEFSACFREIQGRHDQDSAVW